MSYEFQRDLQGLQASQQSDRDRGVIHANRATVETHFFDVARSTGAGTDVTDVLTHDDMRHLAGFEQALADRRALGGEETSIYFDLTCGWAGNAYVLGQVEGLPIKGIGMLLLCEDEGGFRLRVAHTRHIDDREARMVRRRSGTGILTRAALRKTVATQDSDFGLVPPQHNGGRLNPYGDSMQPFFGARFVPGEFVRLKDKRIHFNPTTMSGALARAFTGASIPCPTESSYQHPTLWTYTGHGPRA